MIVETVTVTTTPRTLKSLIETARGEDLVNSTVQGVMVRLDPASSLTVLIQDVNTDTPAVLVDTANATLITPTASFRERELDFFKLSVASGTAELQVICEQTR